MGQKSQELWDNIQVKGIPRGKEGTEEVFKAAIITAAEWRPAVRVGHSWLAVSSPPHQRSPCSVPLPPPHRKEPEFWLGKDGSLRRLSAVSSDRFLSKYRHSLPQELSLYTGLSSNEQNELGLSIMTENFPKLTSATKPQIQEAQRGDRIVGGNIKHIIFQLRRIKDKNLKKSQRENMPSL